MRERQNNDTFEFFTKTTSNGKSNKMNLSVHIADRLVNSITDGRFKIGEKLPSETELGTAFGVSRTVIREAIAKLKLLGLVETRRGVGTTVIRETIAETMPAKKIRPSTVGEILQLLELRIILEPMAARLAAIRHDDNDCHILIEKHAAFTQARFSKSMARTEDFEFHCTIAALTKNPYIEMYFEQLDRNIVPRTNLMLSEINATATDKYLAIVGQEHTRILEAILSRNGNQAYEEMKQHLERARNTYMKYNHDSTKQKL